VATIQSSACVSAAGSAQGFQRGGRGKRQLALAFGNVGERFDACAATQFAHWHSKSTIDFSGKNDARSVTAAEEMIETLAVFVG